MTLLTAEPKEQKFLARFEHVWASLRRYQIRQGLCWTLLAAAVGLLLLAAADWRWELPWNARAAGLSLAVWCTVGVFFARVVGPLRWWTKRRTAVEIEGRFPQLGQRIRTVVQFGGLSESGMDSEGVMSSLVDALEEDTDHRVQPLPLDGIIPWRRLAFTACLAAVPVLTLLLASGASWEWRTALQRSLLSSRPYTTVVVKPGNVRVDQGQNIPVAIELKGRTNREVVLYTRPEGQPTTAWKAAVLTRSEKAGQAKRQTVLEKVKDPIDYRVVAGPAASPTYRIDVRYPLALKSFEAALTPPSYTGVKPTTIKGGDLSVIEGTTVAIRVAFDAAPSEASLIVADPSAKSAEKTEKSAAAARVIPLTADHGAYRAELGRLTKGLVYQITARTSDERLLPKNRYKIDVREDRPPRVAFEEPDEALEVHPIAEVLNRIRVGDDFGLTKAGVVFRFNNGDEQTLLLKDFTSDKDGGKPRTSAALQEWLLLEKLAASPTDSLAYFAFAEDNYPPEAHRSETDMRYIDIRPFKREYKSFEGEPGEQQPEDEFISLGEVIARQRFNLNRGVRLAKHKPTDKTFAEDPLKIATFEETLANMTREVTEGVEGIIGQRVEPLHAAEESMLAAVEALDRGKNREAPEHMGDALRHLIEARNTVQQAIADDPALAQRFRQFDRSQAQKIRKKKKAEEDAEAIAERLEELAQEEDFVYATLAALSSAGQDGTTGSGSSTKPPEPKDADSSEKSEPKDGSKPGDAPKAPSAAEAQSKTGEKPESKKEAPGEGEEKKTEDSTSGKESKKATDKPGTRSDTENPDDRDGSGPPRKDPRREATERQEKIVDEIRDLEDKLKKLDAVSDLARTRMEKAVETTEKASGALARGNTKEATANAKSGGFQLHELARQVKAEVAKEVAEELARARDLANELADREEALGEMADQPGSSGSEPNGNEGSGGAGKLARALASMGNLTDAERLERLNEAGKTLEEILKGASQRAEGKAAQRVRDALQETDATEIVDRMDRIGSLLVGGEKKEASKEAKDLAKTLEVLATRLDVLHQEIVSPRLAEIVELDKRLAELKEEMKTLKTDAQITAWHRDATELARDLEKAGLDDAAGALREALAAGGWHDAAGAWHWAVGPHDFRVAPAVYVNGVNIVVRRVQERIQDLLMKDLISDRDEATPPEFRELVERYYEVLSKDGVDK